MDSSTTKLYMEDYFDLLPNEVLFLIFYYTIPLSSAKEITYYSLVSERVNLIVSFVYSEWKKESMHSVRGFFVKKFENIQTTFTQCIPHHFLKKIPHFERKDSIGIRLDVSGYDSGGDGIEAKHFNCATIENSIDKLRINIVLESAPLRDTDLQGLETVIWNYDKLIINYELSTDYPIPVYESHHESHHHIEFSYLYQSKKGYYTVRDLVERVNQFYSTVLSLEEYNHYLEKINRLADEILGGGSVEDFLKDLIPSCEQGYVDDVVDILDDIRSIESRQDKIIYLLTPYKSPESVQLMKERKMGKYDLLLNDKIQNITLSVYENDCIICDIHSV